MNALLIALKYMPLVLQGVIVTEQAIGAGKGKAKKELVLSSVQAAAQVGEQTDNATVQVISALVDTTVSTLNASGIFKQAPK